MCLYTEAKSSSSKTWQSFYIWFFFSLLSSLLFNSYFTWKLWLGWKHGCRLSVSVTYLQSDTGSILDLKWHFLPIQRDLSGVESSWGERKTQVDGWMSEWINFSKADDFCGGESVSGCIYCCCLVWLMFSILLQTKTHQCLPHNPQWTSWSETWQSELKRKKKTISEGVTWSQVMLFLNECTTVHDFILSMK